MRNAHVRRGATVSLVVLVACSTTASDGPAHPNSTSTSTSTTGASVSSSGPLEFLGPEEEPPCIIPGLDRVLEKDYARPEATAELERLRAQVEGFSFSDEELSYWAFVQDRLREQGLPGVLSSAVLVESGLDTHATSHMGAVGLWQFMRATGRAYGLEVNGFADLRRDPVSSTGAAITYLVDLEAEFGDWLLALAAYNAGPGRIRQALDRLAGGVEADFWSVRSYLPSETRHYVPRILAMHQFVIEVGAELGLCAREPLFEGTTTVLLPPSSSLERVARAGGLSVTRLLELNPSLVADVTPPNVAWPLRVPASAVQGIVGSEELRRVWRAE